MFRHNIYVSSLALSLFAAFTSAHATLVAEWDFTVDENLTVAAAGASNQSNLNGSTTVNTGTTGLGAGYIAAIQDGYLTVPTGVQGLNTKHVSGSDAEWRDYMGSSGFTTGTFATVFRPNFNSGDSGTHGILFNSAAHNGSAGISLLYRENAGEVRMVAGNSTGALRAATGARSWDEDTWYFIAGSWSAGQQLHVYFRAIGDSDGDYFDSGTNLVPGSGGPGAATVNLGAGRTFSDSYTQGANGDIALARLYADDYTSTEAGFESLYNELLVVPEPASLALLLSGVSLISCGRRQR